MSRPSLRLLACSITLLLISGPAFAQRVIEGDLQTQMTADEFRAAGLGKLSPAELSSLNAWLQGRVEQATSTAVEQAVEQVRKEAREEGRRAVVEENRGFYDFGSSEPIRSTVPGQFPGLGKGREFVLANGQVWKQIDDATLAGARGESRAVTITPGVLGAWYLQTDGFNKRAKVQRIK